MPVGIITGSGTYALPHLDASPREVATPFGPVEISEGRLAGVDVLHLSRHGEGHRRLSNQVTHRANIAALSESGADAILAVTVCGTLDPDLALGTLIVFDDLHFISNRLPDGALCTLHTDPGAPGRGHWVYDAPYSQDLRRALFEGARVSGHPVRDGGCYGHVDGPRFNTRAEIRMLANCGVTAVSQTAGPETVLAGEASIPYALVGYATDYANGVRAVPTPVSELLRLIDASTAVFGSTLQAALLLVPTELPATGTHLRFD
ncbi:MAG TPA: MTAP family purine nucleoside phosphorylase [Solirubrobacteraceae bacterium]|nr:MTAP family purine nucleoside phosphorylase [Solirubrobacteraceae bacterium]